MTESDLITLVEIEDKFIAEDIQQLLEDYQIYSVLMSDNPASSVLNVYSGFAANTDIVAASVSAYIDAINKFPD